MIPTRGSYQNTMKPVLWKPLVVTKKPRSISISIKPLNRTHHPPKKPWSLVGVAGAVRAEGKAGEKRAMWAILTQNLAKHSTPILAHAG